MAGIAFYEKAAFGIRALGVTLKQALRMKSPPKRIARQWDPPTFPLSLVAGERATETLSSITRLGALAGSACEFLRSSWE